MIPSFPVGHSIILREAYESLAFIKKHKWLICADLKTSAMLNGLQNNYTKFMYFFCKWDSRAKSEHNVCSGHLVKL